MLQQKRSEREPTPGRMFFVCGETAVGKSDRAIEWAEALGTEILSCDAFCVYRRMDIGTAKPNTRDRNRVVHHGIDLVSVALPYSVDQYAGYAAEVVADVMSRKGYIVVVGGSGLYLKSFFKPAVDKISISEPDREWVRRLEAECGLAGMVRELELRNGGPVSGIDLQNPARVRNGLLRCRSSGKTLDELQEAFRRQPEPFPAFEKWVVRLEREDAELKQRVRRRVRSMLERGLVEEVRALRAEGLEENPTASRAIGYRETLDYLDRGGTVSELEESIACHTDQLIRKQRNWLKRQIPIDRMLSADAAINRFL